MKCGDCNNLVWCPLTKKWLCSCETFKRTVSNILPNRSYYRVDKVSRKPVELKTVNGEPMKCSACLKREGRLK